MRLHQRIRRQQAGHTDDWLITYADTITLLLCLFVVMLSVRSNGESLARAAPIAAAASDDIFRGNPPFHPIACNADPAVGTVIETPPEPILGTAFARPGPAVSAADDTDRPPPVVERTDAGSRATERASVAAGLAAVAAMPAIAPLATDPTMAGSTPVLFAALVDHLNAQGTAVIERRGDRITTLQIGSAAFFSSGSATISGGGRAILGDVAVRLKSGAFAAYHISIEGHTDDTPISTAQFQSNWELSTARAAAVVRYLLEQGIPATKLSAAGYADTFPLSPNRNADGTVVPENQAKNRRVVIKLEKIDKAER
jgi:chemotaxis protein MotB